MGAKYTIPHEVTYYECDVNHTMKLSTMIAIVIKVSEEQSDLLNRGNDYIHQFGVTWIITHYEVFISRLPRVNEKIQVTTQAMQYNKYFCYRDFWITTESGEELVHIESIFSLMNYTTRKISSVTEDIIAPFESEKITKIKRPPKVESLENPRSTAYNVRFYDIDSNHHVNNSVYFDWLIDGLGYDFLTTYEPKYINVRFDKEVEYGKQIESLYEVVDQENGKQTRHAIKIADKKYCEAQIEWQEK
ncbi:MAG: thioesterase [Tetragenococcus halophilus]|uniref:acyl-ACP thioesterase domain-containing protein n=1 Tax=Tetragenococcus halophilus TaxID=51669 RepID=UPI00077C3FE9|nr:acyl-ACP thioesterase domain-containing protein [Tetragenococcus halophilus]MCF1601504.1 thioesterase [Tetragenococcus halophilus]MCF1675722.1 thioesterase [Tetragenococcus halophilus]MCO8286026.1 acyl-[acyl-carrier-protein] thioesterase [Tetragenococcus halophilus]MDN6111645.1 thioesterase [Tetragenococcus halophilus]MDN6128788.1 thioesterase [Tetragenococcus halophilus]